VQAVNSSGSGFPSDQRFIITNPKPLDPPGLVTLLEPNAQEIITDSILFRWSKAMPSVSRYHIQIELDGTILIEDSMMIDTLLMVSMPDKSGIINWKVRAFNPSGYGLWSISDSIRYRRLPPIPLATEYLNMSDSINISTDSITVSWKEVEHAETYEIQVLSADSQFNHDSITTNTNLTLRNLKDNFRYEVRVRACNKRGNSTWSKPLFITVIFPISSIQYENESYKVFVQDNHIHIQSASIRPLLLQVHSIEGKCILSDELTDTSHIIPFHDVPTGMYFIRLGTTFQTIFIQ
jgi:hypothetical protein